MNSIYRYTPGDAAPTQLVSAENVVSFVVDEDALYYVASNRSGVWNARRSGGAGVKISPQSGTEIVVGQDTSFLYVSSSSPGSSTLSKMLKYALPGPARLHRATPPRTGA